MMTLETRGGLSMAGVMLVATPAVDLLLTPHSLGAVHLLTALFGIGLIAFVASV